MFRDPASDPSLDGAVAALAESEILADSLVCEGTEIFLRDCAFQGGPDRTGEEPEGREDD